MTRPASEGVGSGSHSQWYVGSERSAEPAFTPTSVLGVPSRWLLTMGIVLTTCVVIFNIPGVSFVRPRDHRIVAIIFAHVAVGLVALGLVPALPGLISRFAGISTGAQWRYILVAILMAFAAMALLIPWPAVADGFLRREWGIVEPAQFALYSLCAWICFRHAKYLTVAADPRHRVFRVAGWGMVVVALEEVDYLGAVNALLRLTGALDRGRVGSVYVGSAHDVIALVAVTPWLWPVALAALVLTLVAVWHVGALSLAAVWPELVQATSWPLAGATACMVIAQWADVEARALAEATGLQRGRILLVEEPMELLAAMLVSGALLLKVSRDLRRG
jgi:hypothetical protein